MGVRQEWGGKGRRWDTLEGRQGPQETLKLPEAAKPLH